MSRFTRTLTLTLGLCCAALPAAAEEGLGLGVPAGYRMSMNTVETCHKAIMAVMDAAKDDAAIKTEMAAFAEEDESDPDLKTVAWLTKEMETKAPKASRIMDRNDCDAETFWTSTLAMTEAALIGAARQMGAGEVDAPANVKANFDFVMANQTRLEAIGMEQQAAMQSIAPDATDEEEGLE